MVLGMGYSLWQDTASLLIFYFVIAIVRCVKEVYIRESEPYEDRECLDIDISVQRSVKKESKLLLAVLRLAAKIIRTAKKKLKAVKATQNAVPEKSSREISDTDDGSEKVTVEEFDLYEEEASWQRK